MISMNFKNPPLLLFSDALLVETQIALTNTEKVNSLIFIIVITTLLLNAILKTKHVQQWLKDRANFLNHPRFLKKWVKIRK
jgi:hypothetical protein